LVDHLIKHLIAQNNYFCLYHRF